MYNRQKLTLYPIEMEQIELLVNQAMVRPYIVEQLKSKQFDKSKTKLWMALEEHFGQDRSGCLVQLVRENRSALELLWHYGNRSDLLTLVKDCFFTKEELDYTLLVVNHLAYESHYLSKLETITLATDSIMGWLILAKYHPKHVWYMNYSMEKKWVDLTLKSAVSNHLGVYWMNKNEFNLAINCFLRAAQSGDVLGMMNLAMMYHLLQDYNHEIEVLQLLPDSEIKLEYYSQALNLAGRHMDLIQLGHIWVREKRPLANRIYLDLIDSCMSMDQYEQAIKWIELYEFVGHDERNREQNLEIENGQQTLEIENGQHDESIRNRGQNLGIGNRGRNEAIDFIHLLYHAECLFEMKQPTEALVVLDNFSSQVAACDSHEWVRLKARAMNLRGLIDHRRALEYFRKAHFLSPSNHNLS